MTSVPESQSAPDPAEAIVGTIVADRYRIEALLGAGGMGAVYKATHVRMQKTVAVKLLHPEMADVPEVLARFEREAVAASSIVHPNLAAAIDFGKLPDESFYLVMEFIPGQSLGDLLSGGALPPERVVRIGVQIAAALEAAHAAGVVHRDLKPDNVMLRAMPGDVDVVKLLDLGIAKVPVNEASGGKPLTAVGTVLGTPEYMSPEQAIGGKVDHRSDLYSLGVVLYEMTSGAAPFSGDGGPYAAIARHISQAPPPLPSTVPAPLATLILQLLEKTAAARPQSAREVIERLEGALSATVAALPGAIETEGASGSEQPSVVAPAGTKIAVNRRVAFAAGAIGLVALGAWLAKTIASSSASESEPTDTGPNVSDAPVGPATPGDAPTGSIASSPPVAPSSVSTSSPRAASPQKNPRRKPAKKEERKTGPGGIYVPPPEDWF